MRSNMTKLLQNPHTTQMIQQIDKPGLDEQGNECYFATGNLAIAMMR